MLRSLSPWTWVSILAALGVIVIGSVAIVDHESKANRLQEANVAAWYCEHRATRCDVEQSDAIESRWVQRERAYKIAFGGFLVAAAVAVVVARQRRRR